MVSKLAAGEPGLARVGVRFAIVSGEGTDNVQRSIEIVIGKLVTDEEFRSAYLREPEATLVAAATRGLNLSAIEIAALLATDRTLWDRVACELDTRLQKANLKRMEVM